MPDYMHYQVLSGMDDVFCAANLWQAPGFALFSRKPGLRDLLERWPREVRGKNMTRCFSHVILSLPQETLEDDEHLARGSRARELQLALQQKHQADFGDLLDADEVRYQLVPDSRLMPDEIGVRFGHAVYIPAQDETPQGRLRFSPDGLEWHLIGAVYSGQRIILLGGDTSMSSFQVANWPFGADMPALLINDGVRCHLRTKGRLHGEPDKTGQCFRLQLEQLGCYLKYEAEPGLRSAAIWKPRPPTTTPIKTTGMAASGTLPHPHASPSFSHLASSSASHLANVPASTPPDACPSQSHAKANIAATANMHYPQRKQQNQDLTYVPASRRSSRLSLVALALPRLDGYRQLGLASLEIGFNRQLQICAADAAALRIRLQLDNQIRVGTSKGWQAVALPSRFTPFQEEELRLAPCHPALQERYCATLNLPDEISVPLHQGQSYLFGRGVSNVAPLCVLGSAHFLHTTDTTPSSPGHTAPASADQLGLSRRAFRFEARKEGLLITREAPNQALYHLDPHCQWLDNPDPEAENWILPSGHHLIAGNYVLRYDA